MLSPGQQRGTCGHVRLCLTTTGNVRIVGTRECMMIRVSRSKNVKSAKLSRLRRCAPTYQSRKEREFKKSSSDSPDSATPTLVDPADVSVLGRVHKESDGSSPASKKKRADPSPTPKASSKKKSSSSKSRSDDIKDLDEKWSERFARLEAMLVSMMFTVPVNPVQNPPSVVTSDQPFLILEPPPLACPLV